MNSIKNSLLKTRLAKAYTNRGQEVINEIIDLNDYKYSAAPFHIYYSDDKTRSQAISIEADVNKYVLFKTKYFKCFDFVLQEKGENCFGLFGRFSKNKSIFHIEYIFLLTHLGEHSQGECLKVFFDSLVKLSDSNLLSITLKKADENMFLYKIVNDWIKQHTIAILNLIK